MRVYVCVCARVCLCYRGVDSVILSHESSLREGANLTAASNRFHGDDAGMMCSPY